MVRIIPLDNHIHTNFSDGKDNIGEIVESAEGKGLEVITTMDHYYCPTVARIDSSFTRVVTDGTVKEYVDRIKSIKKEGLLTLVGLEVDYLPEAEKEIRDMLDNTNLDFALVAVHNLQKYYVDGSPEESEETIEAHGGIDGVIRRYFTYLAEGIISGMFDGVAHLDLFKKLNKDNMYFSEDDKTYVDCVNICLRMIKEHNLVLEVNTSGFDKPVGVQYPSKWILKRSSELGIDITIGSDAHNKREIARHFGKAEGLIRECGYKKIAYFEKRQRKYFNLEK